MGYGTRKASICELFARGMCEKPVATPGTEWQVQRMA